MFLNESPDQVFTDGDRSIKVKFNDFDMLPVVFGWYKDKDLQLYKYIKADNLEDQEDAEWFTTHEGLGDLFSTPGAVRTSYTNPGRFWMKIKTISFWSLPDKDDMMDKLHELMITLKHRNNDDIDFFDGAWKINLPNPDINFDQLSPNQESMADNWINVDLLDYLSSNKTYKTYIKGTDHAKSPLKMAGDNKKVMWDYLKNNQQNKEVTNPYISSKNESFKNIVRNSLNESPDFYLDPDTHHEIKWFDAVVGSVTFGWFDDKLYTKFTRDSANEDEESEGWEDFSVKHVDVSRDNKLLVDDLYDVRREDYEFPGRLWIKSKVISFWDFPTPEEMPLILKELSDEIKIDISPESGWRIDVLPRLMHGEMQNDAKSEWHLIPLGDYTGSGKVPASELKKAHFDYNKKVPTGSGSSNPKYKNKIKWKMASPVESYQIKNILSDILYESEIIPSIEAYRDINTIYEELMLEKLLIGEPVTIPELRDLLNKKILNFEFIKIDGEVRPAKGTTMMKHIPKTDQPSGLNKSSDSVAAFYDLSKDAWRSVSNKSKEAVIQKDEDSGKLKVVVSDKKPTSEPVPTIPTVNGERTKTIPEPVQPIVQPTIVPDEIPQTPDPEQLDIPVDGEEAIDVMDPTVIADDIETSAITVDPTDISKPEGVEVEDVEIVEPEEEIDSIDRPAPEESDEVIDLEKDDEEEEIIDIL